MNIEYDENADKSSADLRIRKTQVCASSSCVGYTLNEFKHSPCSLCPCVKEAVTLAPGFGLSYGFTVASPTNSRMSFPSCSLEKDFDCLSEK